MRKRAKLHTSLRSSASQSLYWLPSLCSLFAFEHLLATYIGHHLKTMCMQAVAMSTSRAAGAATAISRGTVLSSAKRRSRGRRVENRCHETYGPTRGGWRGPEDGDRRLCRRVKSQMPNTYWPEGAEGGLRGPEGAVGLIVRVTLAEEIAVKQGALKLTSPEVHT